MAAEGSAVSSAVVIDHWIPEDSIPASPVPTPLSNTLAYIFLIAKGSAPSQTSFQKGCRLINMSEFIGVY